jgi:cobalt/nickel transport system permease protein
MRHDFLDRYARLRSPVHRLPALTKTFGSLCLVIATVSVDISHVSFFVTAGAVLLIVAAVSSIPWSFILKRLLLLEPFAAGIALMAFLQPDGTTLFLSIMTKSTICLFTMVLLSNTTPFADLLHVLRRLGVPGILITIMALMYRYLFVLIDESERLNRARRSRTFTTARFHRWHALASLIGQLFIRSTERAERIFTAMTARGWK